MTVVVGGDEEGLPRGWMIQPRTDALGARKVVQIEGRPHWIMDLMRAKFDSEDDSIEWEFVECLSFPAAWAGERNWDLSEDDCIADLVKMARAEVEARELFKADPLSEILYPKDQGWTTVDS